MRELPRIVLLAAREQGYRNLMRLIRAPSSTSPRTSRRTSSLPGLEGPATA